MTRAAKKLKVPFRAGEDPDAAAAAANSFGKNAFGIKFNGVTLHDAVRVHSENTIRIGPLAIKEGDTGHTGKYLKPNGYAAHLAWLPVYLSQRMVCARKTAAHYVAKYRQVSRESPCACAIYTLCAPPCTRLRMARSL